MKTFDDLFNAAKEKGFEVSAYSTYFDRWGDRAHSQTFISIQIRDYIWFTWSFYSESSPYLYFLGRYSQRTGATQKTWRKEHNALVDLGLETVKF